MYPLFGPPSLPCCRGSRRPSSETPLASTALLTALGCYSRLQHSGRLLFIATKYLLASLKMLVRSMPSVGGASRQLKRYQPQLVVLPMSLYSSLPDSRLFPAQFNWARLVCLWLLCLSRLHSFHFFRFSIRAGTLLLILANLLGEPSRQAQPLL
jgi:hypothetical protein